MSPIRFWRTTPAQLSILSSVHKEVNDPTDKPKVARTVEEVEEAGIMI